ncbi:amino acid-binding protein, partial [Mycobacterium sp.]|uniref:amino acid-binding protein n=1 Tax=Mycobacterium sp. TaxID=1785 RepID=UPI003F80D518
MPSYLLRIELVDRPGSLGSLAVALGSVGADILSLDVVERRAGYATDDLVIELPPGAMPDRLITAAEALSGVRVDSVRPHTGLLEAHRELELLDHVAAADGKAARLQVLADGAPKVLRVSWCTVLRSADGELQRLAGSPGAPETKANSAPWLPIERAVILDSSAEWVPKAWRDMDMTMVAAPLGDPHTAVVLGRPGPEFR